MSELNLDNILQKLYVEGYRDTTRRASGMSAYSHASKNKIKRLILNLITEAEYDIGLGGPPIATVIRPDDLRKKVEAL